MRGHNITFSCEIWKIILKLPFYHRDTYQSVASLTEKSELLLMEIDQEIFSMVPPPPPPSKERQLSVTDESIGT